MKHKKTYCFLTYRHMKKVKNGSLKICPKPKEMNKQRVTEKVMYVFIFRSSTGLVKDQGQKVRIRQK